MKVVITMVAWQGWYHKGLARAIQAFDRVSPGFELQGWLNVLPHGCVGGAYTGYCAKPYALLNALRSGADIGILIDASVYPIRHIQPLVDYISDVGYYLQPSGFKVGQWTSDAMLRGLGVTRDQAMEWNEVASGIVGLDFRRPECVDLLERWCGAWPFFPGHHSNDKARSKEYHYRNVGHVSDDPRCLGHRHDQAALSIIANQMGCFEQRCDMPRFVAYAAHGGPVETTVLLIEGMG